MKNSIQFFNNSSFCRFCATKSIESLIIQPEPASSEPIFVQVEETELIFNEIEILPAELQSIEDEPSVIQEIDLCKADDEDDEDDDINITKLLPSFINNLKKDDQEEIDDDPSKIYANEILFKKLETIESGNDDKLNRKTNTVGMTDELSLADYLHQRLFFDMMKKKKSKKSKKNGNLVKNKSKINFDDDVDDDLYDRFESTLLYRYGLATQFYDKGPSKSRKNKYG